MLEPINIASSRIIQVRKQNIVIKILYNVIYEVIKVTSNSLINEIKQKDLDVEKIAERIIHDEKSRNEVVNLINHQHIMVYYHSYYVLSRASELRPQLFYVYWEEFVSLLYNKNSYKRDIGMTLIANLITEDVENKFDDIYDSYTQCIHDEKFMTAQCCVKNLKKIVLHREDLIDKVVQLLLCIESIVPYKQKQKELLKYDILGLFQGVYDKAYDKDKMQFFINSCVNSISPKTRKLAITLHRELM